MAVTIEKRPIGVVLGTCVSATINQDYNSVYATVNYTSHGLSDGDYVYIQSNVENYNGFWKIEVTNANEFILIDNPYVEWIVDADITYCPQITTHGWSCVHLPIVYELSNTKWPVNSVDTARTISSISDDNGYVNLNLSGSLGTFEDLSFIKISNSPDSDFDGVYQIIDKLSTSNVTINLSYSSVTASGITGATIQLYYSNYNIVVKVYAGLNSSHVWADQKPYALVATLELIPDSDNKVKFSINEYLMDKNMVTNNLLLATLPSNIDAWKQFYIEVAEQYDTSDGYTVGTFEGAFASDQSEFEGYAVNAKLPFKNIQSGYLSDYVMNNSTAKFLTLFTIPVLFSCTEDVPDCYSDISFILPALPTQQSVSITGGDGSSFANTNNGNDDWTLGTATVSFSTAGKSSTEAMYKAFGVIAGNYSFNYNVTYSGTFTATGAVKVGIVGLNAAGVVVTAISDVATIVSGVGNTVSGTATLSPATEIVSVGWVIQIAGTLSSGSVAAIVNSFSISAGYTHRIKEQLYLNGAIQSTTITQIDAAPGLFRYPLEPSCSYDRLDVTLMQYTEENAEAISETKQLTIECGCSNQEIRISWLNNLGGFDYWNFTGETEHAIDITNSGETKQNIFPNWPKSYGEHADTIRKQTFRESANRKFVFSQFLTEDEANAIAYIKSSPLVQIVNSRQDRRTVIVDTDSFTKFKDGDKTYQISFNILYTDDIPSQRA